MSDDSLDRLRASAKRASRRSQYRVSVDPRAILTLFAQRDALRAGLEDAERALRRLAEPPDPRPRIDL